MRHGLPEVRIDGLPVVLVDRQPASFEEPANDVGRRIVRVTRLPDDALSELHCMGVPDLHDKAQDRYVFWAELRDLFLKPRASQLDLGVGLFRSMDLTVFVTPREKSRNRKASQCSDPEHGRRNVGL